MAGNFNIAQDCVRVAVVRYSDAADATIPLSQYGDINSLLPAIRALTLLGGRSNLATALQTLRTRAFARNVVRSGATLVAGILTDRLTCNSQIVSEASYLKNTMGVVILGVAVTATRAVDTRCFRQIVSSGQYFEVPSYGLVNNFVSQAARYACVNVVPTPTTTPGPVLAPSKYVGATSYSAAVLL